MKIAQPFKKNYVKLQFIDLPKSKPIEKKTFGVITFLFFVFHHGIGIWKNYKKNPVNCQIYVYSKF